MDNSKNISAIINRLFVQAKWTDARRFIEELLKNSPDDHWLLTRLGTTYYEESEYPKALELYKQAFELSPNCPLVLWDYAGALDMLQKTEEAIRVYLRLIRRGSRRIAYDNCGEGIRSARSLVNDCHYRLGSIYARMTKLDLARKYLEKHIMNRSRKCPSIYHLSKVKRELKQFTT